jgi:hypothetical protein
MRHRYHHRLPHRLPHRPPATGIARVRACFLAYVRAATLGPWIGSTSTRSFGCVDHLQPATGFFLMPNDPRLPLVPFQ